MTQPACKLDHMDPDVLPQALCRACHPEYVWTTERRKEAIAGEREAVRSETRKADLLRALGKAQAGLAAAERKVERGGGSQGIGVRQARSYRRKVEQLTMALKETGL